MGKDDALRRRHPTYRSNLTNKNMIVLSLLNVVFLIVALILSSVVSIFLCNLFKLGREREWECEQNEKKGGSHE